MGKPASDSALRIFQSILSPDQILTAPEDLAFYGTDASREFSGSAGLVLLPRTVEEVAALVRAAGEHGIPLVPSGGRTGYSGGAAATKGEAVLSLTKMNRIVSVDRIGQVLICEAGATTEQVQNAARAAGLYYPVDFASRGSSQIGGNIATNAGGVRVVRYGTTREWVLGLKAVTGRGEILNLNGALVKNQTGYDLRNLLIGSEGTLAVIAEATLRLTNEPQPSQLALCAVESAAAALAVMTEARAGGMVLTLCEFFERPAMDRVIAHWKKRDPFAREHAAYLLLEAEEAGAPDRFAEWLSDRIAAGAVSDAVLAEGESKRAELMSYRELISETLRVTSVPHKNDISVAVAAIPDFLGELSRLLANEYKDYEVITFGHLGDGNLHVNVLKPAPMKLEQFKARAHELDRMLFEAVARHGGSISAEHGVGLLKRDFLSYSRSGEEIELMRAIKRVFDPHNILNPGKLLSLRPGA